MFIDWIVRNLFARQSRHIAKNKKLYKDCVGYLYSLTHHLVVVPWAMYAMYLECSKSDDEWKMLNFATE
jgi:hypothetical protein